jgi:type IV pilus assembly protein PilO
MKVPNITLPTASSLKEPKFLVRAALGLLLASNLVAAVFAFHLVGDSPEALNRQFNAATTRLQAEQMKLNRSRLLTSNIDKGRTESETFLASYLTSRRHTYSTIIDEIHQAAKTTGMTQKETTIATLDPIEGSDDLDILSLSANFEGGYTQLVKFVNLLDRSPRFLVIESMQATPETKGDTLNVVLKLNAFVKDDPGGVL